MRFEEIEVHTGHPGRPFRQVGPVTAKVGSTTLFHPAPTIEAVNSRLREAALGVGANAVINVTYRRGTSLTSWKMLTANGTAVILSLPVKCPYCREPIHPEAIQCKHCGEKLPAANTAQSG